MKINDLQLFFEKNKVLWTSHCLQRMGERDIKRADVKNCILNGEIIEDYPDDFPNPSCLIFGATSENKILHVVAGTDGDYLYIITAYYPSKNKFEQDMKTRRK
ncbi:MAG: DUF4258 domain-containing protein [Synergistaceae bacterium]|nr:DUF4258 domain-containing protein [Synergistaceae bacterium]